MSQVMVRYTVKPDRVAENEELVRAVYAEIDETEPEGLRYSTFRLDDGATFVHIAEMEDGTNPLADLAAFKRFRENLGERCEAPLERSPLEAIGAYRF